jgi:hypothetical protein
VSVILKGAHLREEFVDDGEREFVDVLVAVLLESLNLVQTLALLYHQTHLIHQPSLGGRLQQHRIIMMPHQILKCSASLANKLVSDTASSLLPDCEMFM